MPASRTRRRSEQGGPLPGDGGVRRRAPFPVGKESRCRRRAPACATSAGRSDPAVPWRNRHRIATRIVRRIGSRHVHDSCTNFPTDTKLGVVLQRRRVLSFRRIVVRRYGHEVSAMRWPASRLDRLGLGGRVPGMLRAAPTRVSCIACRLVGTRNPAGFNLCSALAWPCGCRRSRSARGRVSSASWARASLLVPGCCLCGATAVACAARAR